MACAVPGSGLAVSNSRHGRIRNGAALVALLVLAAIVAGCGGDSGSSEATLRKKLEGGAAKLEDARSFEASIGFEIEEDGEEPQEIGCLDLSLEGGKPEKIDLLFFDLNCSGGSEAHEVIAVGRRAWGAVGQDGEHWQEATISPAVLHEVGNEQTELAKLFRQAEQLEAHPDGGAVEEGSKGQFVEVTSYTFEAPASAFPDSSGDDIDDTQVEFEALLDRRGFLRELILHGDEEGTGATVTEKYERIDQDLEITPPHPSLVHGPRTTIRSRQDFEELFGLPSS